MVVRENNLRSEKEKLKRIDNRFRVTCVPLKSLRQNPLIKVPSSGLSSYETIKVLKRVA